MIIFNVHIDGLGSYATDDARIVADDLTTMLRDEEAPRRVTIELQRVTVEQWEKMEEFEGF